MVYIILQSYLFNKQLLHVMYTLLEIKAVEYERVSFFAEYITHNGIQNQIPFKTLILFVRLNVGKSKTFKTLMW